MFATTCWVLMSPIVSTRAPPMQEIVPPDLEAVFKSSRSSWVLASLSDCSSYDVWHLFSPGS